MNSSRRILLPLLVLLVMALGVACSHDNAESNSRQGNVRVMLTAAPITTSAATAASSPIGTTGTSTTDFDDENDDDGDLLSRLEQVNVTFASLLARNLDGDLVDLVIDLPRTVDLIPVIAGHEISLPTGTLPPGMYDQIVVVITHVEFVFLSGFKVALTPPGGGWTRIVPVAPFEVIEGQTTTIELRLRTFEAFREFDGEFKFFPDFDCERRD
ncbi:MAG: DUF4382 domain-containing protein [Acidobacteria bacterium]|nr:DUF4382 domain-containing protein [Acidobacteriota bacterium]